MHLDANSVAQNKAFADQLRQVVAKIGSGGYIIDESGDTLNTLVGLVVTKLGADSYTEATTSAPYKLASTEKDKVVALLSAVIDQLDRLSGMSESILGMMGQFGISSVQWVDPNTGKDEDDGEDEEEEDVIREGFPRGYFVCKISLAGGGDSLMSDYVEDYVDAGMGITDLEQLKKIAWDDFNNLDPEIKARLD